MLKLSTMNGSPEYLNPQPRAAPATVNHRLFDLEMLEDILVITLVSENIGFAELGMPHELDATFELLHHAEIQHVLVDFSQIDYFSSAVLEALLRVWLRVKLQHGRMGLCCLSPIGREIFQISRFDTLWPVSANRAEGLMSLHDSE